VVATMMDGVAVAQQMLQETGLRAAQFERLTGRAPALATVLVGDDPASRTYVRMKTNRCRSVGINLVRHDLPTDASTEQVLDLVTRLADDGAIDGILVQHPMPAHINERQVFDAIRPVKDVDGVTSSSRGARSATK